MNLNALSLVELGAFPKFRVRVPNCSKSNHASCFFNPNVKMPPRSQSSRSLIITLPSNARQLPSFLRRDCALTPTLRATTKDDDDDDDTGDKSSTDDEDSDLWDDMSVLLDEDDDDTGDKSSSDDEDSDLWDDMSVLLDEDYVHYGLIYYNVLVLSCQITWMMQNNLQIPESAKKDCLSFFQRITERLYFFNRKKKKRIIERFRTSDVKEIKGTNHYKIAKLFLKQKCCSHSYILSVMEYLPSTQQAKFIKDVAVELMLMDAIRIINLDVLSCMTEEISDLILKEDDYAPSIATSTSTSKFTVAQCALVLSRELHEIGKLKNRLWEKHQLDRYILHYMDNVEDDVVAHGLFFVCVAHGLWPRLVHNARLSLSETYDCIIEMKEALLKINSSMQRFGLLISECMSFYNFKEQKMEEDKISTMEIEDFEYIQRDLEVADENLKELLPNPNMVKSAREITDDIDIIFLGFKASFSAYRQILQAMKIFDQKISEAQVTR